MLQRKNILFTGFLLMTGILSLNAQTFTWFQSTENREWKQTSVKATGKAAQKPVLKADSREYIITFSVGEPALTNWDGTH